MTENMYTENIQSIAHALKDVLKRIDEMTQRNGWKDANTLPEVTDAMVEAFNNSVEDTEGVTPWHLGITDPGPHIQAALAAKVNHG